MSIMFFKVRSVSRASGGNVIASAAYVSRSRMTDLETGRTYDYRRVPGLAHSEIILPAGTTPAAAAWTADRSVLWNAAEAAERRSNSRVGREYTVALPHELADDVRIELARGLAQRIADRHGVAIDVAVHRPGRGDPRNHHAHLLATTREFDADGFTHKATIERSTAARRSLGLAPTATEYRALREIWAGSANERLQEAGLAERLEPRSRRTLELERQLDAVHSEDPWAHLSVAERAIERWKALRTNPDIARESTATVARVRGREHDHGFEL